MENKPNPNIIPPKREMPPSPPVVGGDHIVIQGDVGAGANVGRGSVQNDYLAQGDIVINNGILADGQNQFVNMLGDLKTLLRQAQEKGELDAPLAKEAIDNLDGTTEIIEKEKKPPKPEIIKRLESVANLIGAALDMLTQEGTVGSILLKALPIAVTLIKIATKIF